MVKLDDDLKSNTIRLPEKLLNQVLINNYENNDNDERFRKKRKGGPNISRKDKRKQERELKKQKRAKKPNQITKDKITYNKSEKKGKSPKNVKFATKNEDENDEEDPMEALRKLKEKKNGSNKKSEIRVVKEDDLQDDDLSDFDGDENFDEDDIEEDPLEALKKLKEKKNGSKKPSEVRIVKEDDLQDDDFSDFDEVDEDIEEDPLEALRKLKERKNTSKKNSEVKIVNENELDDEEDDFFNFKEEEEPIKPSKKEKKTQKSEKPVLPPQDRDLFRQDDEDIEYYAKKLGLKNGKKSKLTKVDENDEIGGLLDGLDLDFESEEEEEEEEEKEEEESEEEESVVPAGKRIFEQDDDDIEYHAKKLGLKNGKRSKLSKEDEFDEIGGLLDGLEFDFEKEDNGETEEAEQSEQSESESEPDDEARQKENPCVAPGTDEPIEGELTTTQKYIPPALRKKMALEQGNQVSEETLQLRKSIKGPLNKLSEANIGTIVNELQRLYMSNPRQILNEEITSIILDSIIQQGRILDTFVYLHACVIVALYKLQGIDFGAYFIQELIEKFEKYNQEASKSKESSNLISLLSSLYTFQLISSKLLYDIIKNLITDLNENNADILLRLTRNSGNQMRSDDPSSLKDIVILINEKYANLPKELNNTRIQFLIETISSLKNNKLKILNEANHQLTIRLKKFLGGISNITDPIQVNLEDIHNVSTRGKWWLIGSAWKGNDEEKFVQDVDTTAMNDIIDTAEPNWMELAKLQRMNTDIRRAIFISIMSANDYIEAMTKLDKLSLKRSQEREIPRVLTHCAIMEPSYNPYYGVLANKLCDSHSFRKTFQFMFWDLVKELDGMSEESQFNEDDEETKLRKILNLGRFYGSLLAENSIPLHNLRTINFLTLSSDTQLLLEVLFVSFFDQIGKRSKKNSVGAGMKSIKGDMIAVKFDDKILVERVIKAKDQTTLLRGLQYFLQEKVKSSDVINGQKQIMRVKWGVDAMFDIIDEFLRDAE
ncbi:unnamed protein product [Candida verbasci]|uniref:MI domain-containing protein n=1 Tax=Candida verbasci TaxID=1227364 RepID=A0A9W4TRN0_9ASCO|nr:unnamed protein product [Candida verbasci]